MPKAYLCGSIQDARDGGVKWRDKLKPKLEELGIKVLDPCKSEANLTDGTVNDAKEMIENLGIYGRYKDQLIYEALKIIGEKND